MLAYFCFSSVVVFFFFSVLSARTLLRSKRISISIWWIGVVRLSVWCVYEHFCDEKWPSPMVSSLLFSIAFSHLSLSLSSTGDRYSTFLCMLIYQNRNHIINNENNTESRAFWFSSHFRPNRLEHIRILNVFALRLVGWLVCVLYMCAMCIRKEFVWPRIAFYLGRYKPKLLFVSVYTINVSSLVK